LTWIPFLFLACNGDGDKDDGVEPLTCDPNPDSVWSPGQVAFRDATTDWGLDVLMPVGVRIDAVDYDGDGWPDLSVRGSDAANDFASGGARTSWLLRNRGDGTFEDVTESSGILAGRVGDVRPGFLWAWGDVDDDGDLDVFTAFHNDLTGSETPEVALQDGGHFTLGPADSDVRREGSFDWAAGASFLDVDRDGFLDLWVVESVDAGDQPAQDRLYAGDGTGRFTDVTAAWGLQTQAWNDVEVLNQALGHTHGWSGLACDLTNDGLPELLSASYGRAPNHLWTHLGDSFRNDSIASGYAFDGNQDWSDNWSARCWCSLHRDDDGCSGIPEPDTTYLACDGDDDAFRWDNRFDQEPFRLGGNSGTTVCADLDNDGWQDLFTTEIVHWDVGQSADVSEILHNRGDGTFTRPGGAVTGIQHVHDTEFWDDGDMTADAFDFDNDGWKDVYLGSSDYPGNVGHLFHQKAPLVFEDMLPEEGIDQHRSHGVVAADFDRDGDLDVVAGTGASRCESDCYDTFNVRLFENLQGAAGNWLELRLVGADGSNRSAIGARVEVETDEGTQTTEVGGGFGQWGYQDDLVQHFGLGPSCLATVTVSWPDAERSQTSFQIAGGHRYAIAQGETEPTPE
jgi:enediyne biosynthesis protein E4